MSEGKYTFEFFLEALCRQLEYYKDIKDNKSYNKAKERLDYINYCYKSYQNITEGLYNTSCKKYFCNSGAFIYTLKNIIKVYNKSNEEIDKSHEEFSFFQNKILGVKQLSDEDLMGYFIEYMSGRYSLIEQRSFIEFLQSNIELRKEEERNG